MQSRKNTILTLLPHISNWFNIAHKMVATMNMHCHPGTVTHLCHLVTWQKCVFKLIKFWYIKKLTLQVLFIQNLHPPKFAPPPSHPHNKGWVIKKLKEILKSSSNLLHLANLTVFAWMQGTPLRLPIAFSFLEFNLILKEMYLPFEN